MAIRIVEVLCRCWPDEAALAAALAPFSLSVDSFVAALRSCVHTPRPHEQGGLQQYLANTIKSHLRSTFTGSHGLSLASDRYSPELAENADLALAGDSSGARIFVEIEFRPNAEKDLVKFQIGRNRGTLAAGVLILAIDRRTSTRVTTRCPNTGSSNAS